MVVMVFINMIGDYAMQKGENDRFAGFPPTSEVWSHLQESFLRANELGHLDLPNPNTNTKYEYKTDRNTGCEKVFE